MQNTLVSRYQSQDIIKKNRYQKALSALYEKKQVWDALKSQRDLQQKDEALKKCKFLFYKKIYTIDNEKYYKVIGLDKHYYINIESLRYLSSAHLVIHLCEYTINGMRYKRALLKADKNKNEIYISKSTLKIVFQRCRLESIS